MKEQTNNQLARWMKIGIEIGVLLFAVGIAWATLRGSVKGNTDRIEKHDFRITASAESLSEVKSDIREIKVEQKFISQGIKEIKEKLP